MSSSRTSRRPSKPNSVSLSDSLSQQGSEMLVKLRCVGTLSWVLLAIVTLYISLVNPSNTPAFFSNGIFKFVLFAFVVVVYVLEGPLIGTMFAIAMVLPVIYSSMREGYDNPFIEGYHPGSDEADSDDDRTGSTAHDTLGGSGGNTTEPTHTKDPKDPVHPTKDPKDPKDSVHPTKDPKDPTHLAGANANAGAGAGANAGANANAGAGNEPVPADSSINSANTVSSPSSTEGWCNYAPF